MKKLLLIFFILSSFVQVNAQGFNCGTTHVMNEYFKNNPGAEEIKRHEDATLSQMISRSRGLKTNQRRIIPVVVHIIHENGVENISSDNVQNVIDIMNEDFQKRNADTAQVISPFNTIIGNMNIEFRLATRDPNGNCTNGITRTFDPIFTNAGSGTRPIVWPRDQYLNIWVVKNIGFGAGAYATIPSNGSNPLTDGIVCRADQFGTLPPSNSGNFAARTMTHEAGHWFNLYHPWGPSNSNGLASNCNQDDFVGDTPNTIGVVGQGCPLSQNSCGNLDNVQNFMDYSNCAIMFTDGQATRVDNALISSVAGRNNLWQQANLVATGTDDSTYTNAPQCPPTPNFGANKTLECEGGVINFTDRSFHAFADPNTFVYNWTFPGGTPASSTDKNPQVTYNTAGLYSVTLNVSVPGVTGQVVSRTDLIEVLPGSGSFIAPSYVEDVSDPAWPNSSDASLVWKRVKPNSSLFQFQRTTTAFYSPPASIFLNNFGFNGSGDFELNTPPVDMSALSGTAFIKFRAAQRKRANENELLTLWASRDCGETFNLVRIFNGNVITGGQSNPSAFVPADTSEWLFIAQDISSYAGEPNVTFSFRFGANGGNNLYLDDITISDNPNPDPINSLSDRLAQSVSIYPNPNEGQFRLDFFLENNDVVNLSLVNAIGKSIELNISDQVQDGWNSLEIDTREIGLEAGIYFLNLQSGESNFTRRLIIE